MKIVDKRTEDYSLSTFGAIPAGTIFEVPHSTAILMKLNDNNITVRYFPKDGEVEMGGINAIILRPDERHNDDEWALIEPWAKVRVLNAELVINGNSMRRYV